MELLIKMKLVTKYKGFVAHVAFCGGTGTYFGEIINCCGVISFQAYTKDGLELAMSLAVDCYLNRPVKMVNPHPPG